VNSTMIPRCDLENYTLNGDIHRADSAAAIHVQHSFLRKQKWGRHTFQNAIQPNSLSRLNLSEIHTNDGWKQMTDGGEKHGVQHFF